MPVLCPNCSSPNSERSKFCNSCGNKLAPDMAGRCPACDAPNPPTNIFCDDCGARLVPTRSSVEDTPDSMADTSGESSVRGLSLPSREPADDEEASDWLTQLRAGFGRSEVESDHETGESEDEQSGDLPEESIPIGSATLQKSTTCLRLLMIWKNRRPVRKRRQTRFLHGSRRLNRQGLWLRSALSCPM